jgi:hypothetical protein
MPKSVSSHLPIIANPLIEVQPMPLPSCHLFYLDERYSRIAEEVDREALERLRGLLKLPDEYVLPKRSDRGRFPHSCPRCGGPAYVGLNDVDCAEGCA